MIEMLGYEDAHRTRYQLNKEHKEFIAELEKELGCSIRLRFSQGRPILTPIDDDAVFEGLVIYDYASKLAGARPQTQEYMYIPREDDKKKARDWHLKYHPSFIKPPPEDAETIVINVTDIEGYAQPLGSVGDRMLWLGTPLKNFYTMEALRDVILPAAKKAMETEFWAKRQEELSTKAKTEFMKYVETGLTKELKQRKAEAAELESKIANLGNDMIVTQRSLSGVQKKLEFATGSVEGDKTAIELQFDELMSNIHIDRMFYNEPLRCLDIYTNELFLYSPTRKERAPLGKFKIQFFNNGTVQMFNVTNPQLGRPAPHVDNGGVPCWGASQQAVTKVAATGELVALFEITINFLEHYNPRDDYARHAAYWMTPEKIQLKQNDGSYLTEKEIKEGKVKGEADTDSDKKGKKAKKEETTNNQTAAGIAEADL